jgi:hypothetical protein
MYLRKDEDAFEPSGKAILRYITTAIRTRVTAKLKIMPRILANIGLRVGFPFSAFGLAIAITGVDGGM